MCTHVVSCNTRVTRGAFLSFSSSFNYVCCKYYGELDPTAVLYGTYLQRQPFLFCIAKAYVLPFRFLNLWNNPKGIGVALNIYLRLSVFIFQLLDLNGQRTNFHDELSMYKRRIVDTWIIHFCLTICFASLPLGKTLSSRYLASLLELRNIGIPANLTETKLISSANFESEH